MTDLDLLRAELDEFAQPKKERKLTVREERIIAGFEEIQAYVVQHNRLPEDQEGNDIFERLYAVRLERIRASEECCDLLAPFDYQNLLDSDDKSVGALIDELDEEQLLTELKEGLDSVSSDLTELRHVRSTAERRVAAEEIAQREVCEDFDLFEPLFLQVKKELDAGVREARRFAKDASVEQGNFFILGGQLVYVAAIGEDFDSPQGKKDARMQVIYANGTESNLLRLSLQRALYKDESGRRITEPNAGPLFNQALDSNYEQDSESGTIYVLRSLSDHPYIAEHRNFIHKIGITANKVETRIARAAHDATFLLADVEVVATYKLTHINRSKIEALLHRIFAPVQLDLTISDRFGNPVKPREWFLVPLAVIDEAIQAIQDDSIAEIKYDPNTATLITQSY